MISELDKLRVQREEYESRIEELQEEIDDLNGRVIELEELEEDMTELDISTIDKVMMFEKLKENWHLLTMGDIDAICKV